MTTAGVLQRQHRESAAVAVFGSWMIAGLFLDGWAHKATKPETFFSPWHGILYSGFIAAVVWFAWDGWRTKAETVAEAAPQDKVLLVGLVAFIIGAVGDGFWHQIFGIEVNLEALVSPSHLTLLIGGFLMVTSPLRTALSNADYKPDTWREWFPQGVTLTLAAVLILFFTQYLSAFNYVGASWHSREPQQIADLGSVMATNAILMIGMLWTIARWRPPFGAFTLFFTAAGLLLSGLDGFNIVEVVIAFVIGGLVADIAISRNAPNLVVAIVTPLALWSSFFFVANISYTIDWSPELWAGAIVLATASSALLSSLLGSTPGLRSAGASMD